MSAGRRDSDIAGEKKAHLRRLLDEQVAEKRAAVEAEKAEDKAVRCPFITPTTITHACHTMRVFHFPHDYWYEPHAIFVQPIGSMSKA